MKFKKTQNKKILSKKILSWILTKISVLTMVLMPVAQGQAAEQQQHQLISEISKATVQNSIVEMGLNKSITYGEFFKKNKNIYPERLQKELAPYFTKFANTPMPQFEVSTAKDSEGNTHPVLRVSQNGQLHNIQIYGETERYAKFNNTNLSEVDLINFDDALVRLSAGDVKLRNQLAVNNISDEKTSKSEFSGFPAVDKESWVKLTPEQRAGYVISMRLLYNDAHGVLLASKNKPGKKGKNKKVSILDSLFQTKALAQKNLSSEPVHGFNIDTPPVSSKGSSQDSSDVNQGIDSCLVAGYVTSYNGRVCKYSEMKAEYKDESKLAGKAFAACGNKIACNPLVFGTPNGSPICIDRANNSDVQKATHYEGPCERNNHTNDKISFLNNENDKTGRYDSSNIKMSADQIRAESLRQQGAMLTETKNFISGILKFKVPALNDLFISNKPNEDVIKELVKIKNDFNDEIKQATDSCKAASKTNNYHENNFWGACDQLQRRFIFVKEYLDKNPGCIDKSPVNPDTLMCSCPDGKSVAPGAACSTPIVVPPAPKSHDPTHVVPGPHVGKCDPECDASKGEKCELQAENEDGVQSWQCVNPDHSKPKPIDKNKKSGFGIFLKKALPWVAGAGVLAAMYFLWKPKIPKLNAAADKCPNGTNAPCGVQCTAPKVVVSGLCGCAACPPGQTIIDANACTCGLIPVDPTVKVVCPDGVTLATTLADCPKTAQYLCWDGSYVLNAINCPEKASTPVAPVPAAGKVQK